MTFPFVLDASVTLSWCFPGEMTPQTRQILESLLTTHAEVPQMWSIEIANGLAVAERRGRITAVSADLFLETLSRLDIRTELRTPLIKPQELLPLARRDQLTAYDANYLELAQRRKLPLATMDKALQSAALRHGTPLFIP